MLYLRYPDGHTALKDKVSTRLTFLTLLAPDGKPVGYAETGNLGEKTAEWKQMHGTPELIKDVN